jgi:RNA polymerase sigma-70 factor (sigma-E family)
VDAIDEQFRHFVAARMDTLRGLAYLTCGDWQAAEDAVARSLARLYARWGRVGSPHRYATRMVVRAAIDEVRRPWRRERAAGDHLPDVVEPDRSDSITDAVHVRNALRQLPPGQRAVLVLRFYEDFSVDEVAEVLGRRPGTIKSQTARGLATLRRLLAAHDIEVTERLEGRNSNAPFAGTTGYR